MSYNSLFGLGSHSADANLEGWWPLQDNAASTVVLDQSGNGRDGTLGGGSNTADLAVAGPGTWLSSALRLAAYTDYVERTSFPALADAWSAGIRVKPNAGAGSFQNVICLGRAGASRLFKFLINDLSGNWTYRIGQGSSSQVTISGSAISTSAYVALALTYDKTTFRGYENGSQVASTATSVTSYAATSFVLAGGISDNPSVVTYPGDYTESWAFSRTLDSTEIAEIDAGTEPVNVSAPTISGDPSEGSTLTCDPGTWGLPSPFSSGSNGTLTYHYQWTRSGVDISGATSSTYTTQAADVGEDIGCRTRSMNDGGYDADADTNSSNTITVTSANSFQPAWAQHATAIAL